MLPPLAISAGDPAGVSPAVTAAALAQCLGSDRALVFGDANWMERALHRYGLGSLKRVATADAGTLNSGEVGLVHVADWPISMVEARAPTMDGGVVQREALQPEEGAGRHGPGAIGHVAMGQRRAIVNHECAFASHCVGMFDVHRQIGLEHMRVGVVLLDVGADERQVAGCGAADFVDHQHVGRAEIGFPGVITEFVAGAQGVNNGNA